MNHAPVSAARNIIITAKNDKLVEFYDGTSHKQLAALDMPASVHELALSADGRKAYGSVFGGGVFGKNKDPDHRVVVIDLASRRIDRFIDVGTYLAPHGMMFSVDGLLWVTAEMNNALLGIDVKTEKVVSVIDIGSSAHWLTLHPNGQRLYASNKQTPFLGVIDLIKRRVVTQIDIPNCCEGVAISNDGSQLYVASHAAPELNVIDTRTEKLIKRVMIQGIKEIRPQLRRVRLTPDDRWALLSSKEEGNVAIFSLPEVRQTALVSVGKSPMGFGFPSEADRALVCNHDEGTATVIDLVAGVTISTFATGKGCEFAEYYAQAGTA